MLAIVDAIRSSLGSDRPIATRLGVFDAIDYPFGWGVAASAPPTPDMTEPLQLVGMLADRGVRLIDITVGNPYFNPHFGRPFNRPATGRPASPEHPLEGVARLIDLAGRLQRAYPDVAIVGTGYSWLGTMMAHVAAGVLHAGQARLVGGGRLALAYPDFAADILARGAMDPRKVCVACSACSDLLRAGGPVGCAVRDAEIYEPHVQACRRKLAAQ
jgi:2,4-dienoyl-CoA reductase-like NADH-dependent reductase (Old Yellow Enzyme family)